MNDPNGLVWSDGVYHLFYQFHPFSTIWGPMHWGHAVSSDLVTWKHLPVALSPDEHGTIYSGSAVRDGENLAAVFSFSSQTQGLALSSDGGHSWTKHPGNPILPASHQDFRDPKVFRYQDHWVLVIAAGDHLEFFRSDDLVTWTATGRFDAAIDAGVWECPDLFSLEWKGQEYWVLLLSVGDRSVNGGSGTMSFLGQFDGLSFRALGPPQWLDYGPDNYAGVTWNDAPNGRVFLGWMNNWRYARQVPTVGWRGSMTLPRRLSLEGPDVPSLVQRPAAEFESLRRPTPSGPGEVLESCCEISLRLSSDTQVLVTLHCGEGRTELVWSAQNSTLSLDRTHSGCVDFHPEFARCFSAPLKIGQSELALTLMLDQGAIEVFADQGRTVLTALTFPETQAGSGVCPPVLTVEVTPRTALTAWQAWNLGPTRS